MKLAVDDLRNGAKKMLGNAIFSQRLATAYMGAQRKGYSMLRKFKATFVVALVLPLAACVEDTGSTPVTSGRATVAQVEQSCINRLAQVSQVYPAEIIVTESMGSSEGTVAFLRDATGAPWVCRADGAGNITQLYQGEG